MSVIETATDALWPFAPVTVSVQIAGVTGVTENANAPAEAIVIEVPHVPFDAVNGPAKFSCETVNCWAAAAPVDKKTSLAGVADTVPGGGGPPVALPPPPPPHAVKATAEATAGQNPRDRRNARSMRRTARVVPFVEMRLFSLARPK